MSFFFFDDHIHVSFNLYIRLQISQLSFGTILVLYLLVETSL